MTDPFAPNKQDFKAGLIMKLGLAAAVTFASRVHMVKAGSRPGQPHRLLCHDGSWIEIDQDGHFLRTWGRGRTAREIATAIVANDDGYKVEHLEAAATAAAPGAPRRVKPVLSDDRLKTMADGWRQRGYTDLIEDERGVWVGLGDTRLFDLGDRVEIHGPISDDALAACVRKAAADWNAGLELRGGGRDWSDRDKARLWLACQRERVRYFGYEPSSALIAQWEAEQAASGRSTGQVLRPGDAPAETSSGTVPVMSSSGTIEPEPEVSDEVEPDLATFEQKAADLDRRQADLERRRRVSIKERQDAIMREQHLGYREAQDAAFREREEQSQEEQRLAEACAILDRARELAIEKGLDYKSAVALAKAEHLAERGHDYEPRARLRR